MGGAKDSMKPKKKKNENLFGRLANMMPPRAGKAKVELPEDGLRKALETFEKLKAKGGTLNDAAVEVLVTSSKSALEELQKLRDPETPTLADHIAESYEALQDVIRIKEEDLANEAGREEYNRKAYAILSTMNHHLESIIELARQYSENK